jgi:leader peptidase (prepilin peptidase)/N-methyltransferase
LATGGSRPFVRHSEHIGIIPEATIPAGLIVAFAGVLGALIGSFLNVVLWRVPRGESIVSPPSHCPSCGHELRPLELVPVLSWIGLRGRCHSCGIMISVRYPLVELGVGIVFALIAWLIVG